MNVILRAIAIAGVGAASLAGHAADLVAFSKPPVTHPDCQRGGTHFPGCSYYKYFKDNILPKDLPGQFKLPESDERSWPILILGLTIFTEARMEIGDPPNKTFNSAAAVGAVILRRAGYGSGEDAQAHYRQDVIADVAANHDFSQWLKTYLAFTTARGAIIPATEPTKDECGDEAFNNRLILQDPFHYATACGHEKRLHYKEKLLHSMKFAQCLIIEAASNDPEARQRLSWVGEFGTRFVNPPKADPKNCHDHWPYISHQNLSYCPAMGKDGWCASDSVHEVESCAAKDWPNTRQHYELREAHDPSQVAALHRQIGAFVDYCNSKYGLE